MDLKLKGKIALVTGASSGIGAATARVLAEEGVDVAIGYRTNLAGAQRTEQVVQAAGRRAWLVGMDVTDPTEVARPGMTLTEMGRRTATALPPDYAQKNLLTGRFAEPEEIARVIVFVASPVAGFMTGATIDINGGRLLR